MPAWESAPRTRAVANRRSHDASPCRRLARGPEAPGWAGSAGQRGFGGSEALDGAWLLVEVLAIVSGILAVTMVLLALLDSAVEAVRLQLVTGRGPAASLARRLRLPLAAVLPSIMFGSLAGVTTESVIAGLATLVVIAAAMMAILLSLSG
jgi:hypothetical protein